jgi:2'-5' RNA ligase
VRLFVAIVPPPAVLAELAAGLASSRAAWPGVRWSEPDAWHVTLAFLGEVDDGVLPELRTRLERAAGRHPVQELAIRGGGAFPGAERARVVWAGVVWAGVQGDRPGLAALTALAASVAAGARRAGAPPPDEGRRYRPHLTLARLREPADVRPLTAGLAGLATEPWSAGRIELIRSHLPEPGRPGARPRYESLASWPLKGG